MNTPPKVDVLAVIRHHGAGMRVAAGVADGLKLTGNACKTFADELDRVEAAVAELITADDEFDDANDAFGRSPNMANCDRFCAASKRRRVALARVKGCAALTRIQGGAE